jgi:membrane-bound serine protease (ClpP class)
MKRLILGLLLIFFPLFLWANNAVHIKIQSSISPATSLYLSNALALAQSKQSAFLLMELDTPGGLVTSTREMIQSILNSSIPVVLFVSPKGARAASAGTFLLYASHIAVMADGTNVGAATPVNLMQTPTPKESEKNKSGSAMEKKVLNDSVAYIKSLAQLRNRDINFAIDAVKEGKSISAKDALKIGIIDFMANDSVQVIEKLHRFPVVLDEKQIILDTKPLKVFLFEADLKTKFLMTISNANIAYIFLLLAIYGILFELMNPGSIFPGVIGGISAIVALYALNILPFNYVGLLLIVLGIAFMVAEIFLAGIGILGIGGVIAFVIGSFMLFDPNVIGTTVSTPLVIAIALASFAFFMYIVRSLFQARKEKSHVGLHNLLHKKAYVSAITQHGYKIELDNEIWDAQSEETFTVSDEVEITQIDGLVLHIRSIK